MQKYVMRYLRISIVVLALLSAFSPAWALQYLSGNSPCGTPSQSICVLEEFIGTNPASQNIGEWGWSIIGAGVSYGQFGIIDGMSGFGIGELRTDGILGRVGAIHTGNNGIIDVSLYPTLELSSNYGADATANGNWRWGWTSNSSHTTFANQQGVFFETVAGESTWFCVARAGATTRVNIGISNNIGFSKFLLQKLSATSYQCCINGTCATVSSNVPATNLWAIFSQVANTVLAEPIFAYHDYIFVYAAGVPR